VSEANVLGRNLLVQTTGKDDALLQQTRNDVRGSDTLGKVYRRHAVGLVLRLGSQLLETKVGHGLLDLLRRGLVRGKILIDGAGQNLLKGGIESMDELGRRRGEVGWLLCFVVLHDCRR
jgi:hypothetical protein